MDQCGNRIFFVPEIASVSQIEVVDESSFSMSTSVPVSWFDIFTVVECFNLSWKRCMRMPVLLTIRYGHIAKE